VSASAQSLDGLAFVDLETTGLDPARDEIVEVGVCFVERGAIVARRSWVVRPSRLVPAVITALTGLKDDELATAPTLEQKRAEIGEALRGWTLVAHNAQFEQAFLGSLAGAAAWLDSCELSHLLFPQLPSHALDALVRWARVGTGARHRALEDAEDTFLVMREQLARVACAGRREELEAMVARLSPPQSPDATALVQLLSRLASHCTGQAPGTAAALTELVDESLVGRFVAMLQEDRVQAVDVERDATGALLEAARRLGEQLGTAVTLALPARATRAVAALVVPRRQVCRTALRELVASPAADDAGKRARAWLGSWLLHSATGDPQTHSAFMAERLPEARAMLQLARGCTCTDPQCFVRVTEAATDRAPVVVVSHELALDWLERGAPITLLVAHAEQLPDAERRRTAITLDERRANSLARVIAQVTPEHPLVATLGEVGQWLRHALEGPALAIESATRSSRAWLDVRDLLLGLQKDLSRALAGPLRAWAPLVREFADEVGALLAVPAPVFELVAGNGKLERRLRASAAVLTPRLKGRALLVSAVRGGARWLTPNASWVPPSVVPWSLEAVAEPLGLPALVALGAKLAHDSVVVVLSARPLEALARAFLESDTPIRLISSARAMRGHGVVLGRWLEAGLPASSHVILDGGQAGAGQWRTAVLGCGARHVTLTAETGVADAVAAELADLVASAGGRHVVAR
jgi:DNA polymerase III epsilon subunit-like protein